MKTIVNGINILTQGNVTSCTVSIECLVCGRDNTERETPVKKRQQTVTMFIKDSEMVQRKNRVCICMCAHHTGTRTQYSKQTLQTEATGAPGEWLAAAFQLLWVSSLPIKESGSEARSPGSRLHWSPVASGGWREGRKGPPCSR